MAFAIVLLLMMNLVSPSECTHGLLESHSTLSTILSFIFLAGMAAFLSYMNRSIFLVSSDLITLPLIFILTSLSDAEVMFFSTQHIVAFLTLAALFFILRCIVAERLSGSDYFLWCLLISCSAVFVPQLIWLLIPGYFIMAGKESGLKFKLFLITLAAILIPVIYVSSYLFVFTDSIWYETLFERASECVLFRWPHGFSAVSVFYFLVMGIVILSSAVSVFRNYEQIRNTSLRKQSRFIYPYFGIVSAVLVTGRINTGLMMVFAIPLSMLFLYYGELNGYGRGWRHLVLLITVSTIVFRAYHFI